MPNWIETEDKTVIVNADQVESIELFPGKGVFLSIQAKTNNSTFELLTDLTVSQADEAIKHLSAWLPSVTPRTIRMSELAISVKKQAGTRQLDENGEAR